MLMRGNQLPSDAESRAMLHNALKSRLSKGNVRGILALDDDGVSLASSVALEMKKPLFYVYTNELGRKVISAPVPELRGMELHAVANEVRDVESVASTRKLVQAVGADFKRILVRLSPSAEVSNKLLEMGLTCDCFTP